MLMKYDYFGVIMGSGISMRAQFMVFKVYKSICLICGGFFM